MKDFFISYAGADRGWGEWIAWHLEQAGYSVDFAEWDLMPGQNAVLYKNRAAEAGRIVVVLSEHYFSSAQAQPEWALALAQDPAGAKGKLLPVRVAPCQPVGLLGSVRYVDLVGSEDEQARRLLLKEVQKARDGRGKPSFAPTFPGLQRPSFPGATPPPGEADGPAARPPPESLFGKLVDDKYKVVGTLGQGGMGLVFAAVREDLRVAIKFLQRGLAGNARAAARFRDEARAVNLVGHPGVVSVIDWGDLKGWGPYIVMEYLEGEVLGERLRRKAGPAAPAELHLFWQIASTMATVHRRQIVHRDLKPDNVMVVADPMAPGGERTKILDFGIALVAAEWHGSLARHVTTHHAPAPLGTPTFMAPELCDEDLGQVSDRADVYSLGVMLYLALAGEPPFSAKGAAQVMALHLSKAPRPLGEVCPAAPPELVALVHQMLAKQQADRPAMAEVAERLHELINRDARAEAARAAEEARQKAEKLARQEALEARILREAEEELRVAEELARQREAESRARQQAAEARHKALEEQQLREDEEAQRLRDEVEQALQRALEEHRLREAEEARGKAKAVPLKFQIFKGDQLLRTVRLNQGVIKIGKVSSSHVRLEDKSVNRMHAVIEAPSRDELSIIDLGSSRGTFVNGEKITKAKLRSGDELKLGEIRIVVTLDAPAGEEHRLREAEGRAMGPSTAGMDVLKFQIFKGDQLLKTVRLNQDVIKIGKGLTADLRLEDQTILPTHATIEITSSEGISIINLSAILGAEISVNGKGVRGTELLSSGDELTLGETRIVVTIEAPSSQEMGLRIASRRKRKRDPNLILGIVFGILLLAGAGGIYMLKQAFDKNERALVLGEQRLNEMRQRAEAERVAREAEQRRQAQGPTDLSGPPAAAPSGVDGEKPRSPTAEPHPKDTRAGPAPRKKTRRDKPEVLDRITLAPDQLSPDQIRAGLRAVNPLVQACSGRPGTYNVSMTIVPNGTISSGQEVSKPGDATADCVVKAVLTARFPAFTGAPLFLLYPFTLPGKPHPTP